VGAVTNTPWAQSAEGLSGAWPGAANRGYAGKLDPVYYILMANIERRHMDEDESDNAQKQAARAIAARRAGAVARNRADKYSSEPKPDGGPKPW